MKRELLALRRGDCGCCPGHDIFPGETYKNRRSKAARAKGKRKEHQLVRQLNKRSLREEVLDAADFRIWK